MVETHKPGVMKFEDWPCPRCGYLMNAASHPTADGQLPEPGDLSICLNCTEPFVLKDDLLWQQMTDEELLDLSIANKNQLFKMQALVKQFNAAKRL